MVKILLLDSNSLMNRAFFALPPLMNKKGEVTNAVFGYLSMLSKMISDIKPTHVAAVFDLKAKTFRHKMYEGYKATRRPALPEFISQFPIIKDILTLMNIRILEMEGYEADDIIGTIAKRFDEETIIVSGDKDVLQLVDETTAVYQTKRGVSDLKKFDLEVMKDEGLTPQQIIEYKALAGDASDNIPGAKGIGEKTAKQLLADYVSVDGVYEHIGELKGKVKENLENSMENVKLSHILATIDTHVPIDCSLADMELKPFPIELQAKLLELEFKSLIPRFTYEVGKIAPKTVEIKVEEIVVDKKSVERILKKLNRNDILAIDVADPIRFSLDGRTEYIAYEQKNIFNFDSDDNYGEIYALMMSCPAKKLLFQAKNEMHCLAREGAALQENFEDLQLMSYLVNSISIPQTAKGLTEKCGFVGQNTSAYFYRIYQNFLVEMAEKSVLKLYKEVELPLVSVLFDMEKTGFLIDTQVLDALSKKYSDELLELAKQVYEIAGETFNINSPMQLGKILFEKFQLPHAKKTQGGAYSVSADVLEKLEHPIVTYLLRYRQIGKLNSTYVDGMRSVMDKTTNRVHTIFKQSLTTTGRLSSTEPNLQNIPVREAEGREIRKMFVPSMGNILIAADYSQIELRLLAHFAGDESLIKAYENAEDIHRATASEIFNKPIAEVTRDERAAAKTVNFSIIYGISSFGLSGKLNVSMKKAKEFVDKYFETYPSVKEYMDGNVRFAVEHGYVKTMLGRIRYFPELHSSNYAMREFGKRAAMNMPLQGTASDIIKLAMLRVSEGLKKAGLKAKLILQVHDELIIDSPKNEVKEVAVILKEGMENAVSLRVPLIAEVSEGNNWFEAK